MPESCTIFSKISVCNVGGLFCRFKKICRNTLFLGVYTRILLICSVLLQKEGSQMADILLK